MILTSTPGESFVALFHLSVGQVLYVHVHAERRLFHRSRDDGPGAHRQLSDLESTSSDCYRHVKCICKWYEYLRESSW